MNNDETAEAFRERIRRLAEQADELERIKYQEKARRAELTPVKPDVFVPGGRETWEGYKRRRVDP